MGIVAQAENREITVDPDELDDAIWVAREAVLDTINGSHPTLKAARQGAIARAMIEDWLAGRITP